MAQKITCKKNNIDNMQHLMVDTRKNTRNPQEWKTNQANMFTSRETTVFQVSKNGASRIQMDVKIIW